MIGEKKKKRRRMKRGRGDPARSRKQVEGDPKTFAVWVEKRHQRGWEEKRATKRKIR